MYRLVWGSGRDNGLAARKYKISKAALRAMLTIGPDDDEAIAHGIGGGLQPRSSFHLMMTGCMTASVAVTGLGSQPGHGASAKAAPI